jgi:carbon-monoxide dehydrogenase medium subunit
MANPVVRARRLLRAVVRACTYQHRTPNGRLPCIHARAQIPRFRLHEPATAVQAAKTLSNYLDARAMAGGIDVVNEMKCGAEVRHLVYLDKLDELRRISVTRDFLSIGARATHAEIEGDPNVAWAVRELPDILREVGNVRVRAIGTIGGNLMAASRYYDWLPILMALGAELQFADRVNKWFPVDVLVSSDGIWRIPERLLTEVRIPLWGNPRLRFIRDLKPAISVAVCVRDAAEHRMGRAAVGCMHRAPVVRDLEGFVDLELLTPAVASRAPVVAPVPQLRADAIAAAVGGRAANLLPKAHDDGFASAAYRHAMSRTLITRALHDILETA